MKPDKKKRSIRRALQNERELRVAIAKCQPSQILSHDAPLMIPCQLYIDTHIDII